MKRFCIFPAISCGLSLIFAAGCITGTNTFSKVDMPTTQYCGTGDRPAPEFDILLPSDDDRIFAAGETASKLGQVITLKP